MLGGHGMPVMKDIHEGHGIDICRKERTHKEENTGTFINEKKRTVCTSLN